MKVPIVARLVPRRVLFTMCRPGRTSGRDDMRPASFKNATIEPVNVTPPTKSKLVDVYSDLPGILPMRTPRYAVTRCSVDTWSTSASTLPMLVNTAAKPTTECSAATIWGSSVGVILRPRSAPMREPAPATPANCMRTSGEKPTARRDARMPDETPRIPRMLPCRAVCCEASPEMEPVGQV